MNDPLTKTEPAPLFMCAEERIPNVGGVRYDLVETLYSGKSEFQHVNVVRTKGHGVMLFLDGLVMVSERDEFVYHDMITHVPLFIHPNPTRVLIIGGGDGGTAREVLRHASVTRCCMVEIDGMVVDLSKKFLPQTACAFDHPNLELHIDDGVRFLAETEEKFDVILVDSTDPIGPAAPLFNKTFYRNVHRALAPDGIVVSQGESPFYESKAQKSLLEIISGEFELAHLYNYSNLTYPGGLWSFILGSKGRRPVLDFDRDRVKASGLDFKYYTPEIHRAAFALPKFQQDILGDLYQSPWQ